MAAEITLTVEISDWRDVGIDETMLRNDILRGLARGAAWAVEREAEKYDVVAKVAAEINEGETS